MNKIALFLTLLITSAACTPHRIIYYDDNWSETVKDSAAYYRPMPPEKVDSLWLIKDYYIDGTLQYKGYTDGLPADSSLLQGDATWYLPNGKIDRKVRYKDGSAEGYYARMESSKNDTTKGYEEDDLYYYDYNDHGIEDAVTTSTDVRVRLYWDSYQVAERYENNIGYDDKTSKKQFFDREGKQIGLLRYNKKGKKESGTEITFYERSGAMVSISEKNTYKDGKKIKTRFYNRKGATIAKGSYKDEEPYDGSFHRFGCDFYKITYYKKGVKQKEDAFSDDGSIMGSATYKNGEIHNGAHYDCTGIKNYEEGRLDGKVTTFGFSSVDTTEIGSVFHYSKGIKNGPYKLFTSTGSLQEKGTYQNGLLTGELTFFSDDRDIIDGNRYYSSFNIIRRNPGRKPTIQKISLYSKKSDKQIREYKLAPDSADSLPYLKDGYHCITEGDYNFDGHSDFSISLKGYNKPIRTTTYYVLNADTKQYEHFSALDDKGDLSFNPDDKTIHEVRNGDFDTQYKTYTIDSAKNLVLTQNIEEVYHKQSDTLITTQVFPAPVKKFPLLKPNLSPTTFTQDGKNQILRNDYQIITLKKQPFSITFPGMITHEKASEYHAIQIAAFLDEKLLAGIHTGVKTEDTPFFASATGIAMEPTELSIDAGAHNYLLYKDSPSDKLHFVRHLDDDVLLLRYDVEKVFIESSVAMENIPVNMFYLIILNDKNSNKKIDSGELHKIKVKLDK